MAMPKPPIAPMLAKLSKSIPEGDGWLYEPKWDGFRAIIFRDGDEIYLQSRDLKPLARYFPELVAALRPQLPPQIVLDGEIVIARDGALDFDAILLRIHPAASRIALLAEETPASFVAWDCLAFAGDDLQKRPLAERRAVLERELAKAEPPIFVAPSSQDPKVAHDWFTRFEGAGLDGVVSKKLDGVYTPGQRTMVKTKHNRTADCVVAGFRWYAKGGAPRTDAVGSLLLGLFDDEGKLHHVGVCAAFTLQKRMELVELFAPLRENAAEQHPWRAWAEWQIDDAGAEGRPQRRPGMTSRWNRGKDLSWQPLRLERVVEVSYDHMQGDRFRHATQFVRWRPDKAPNDCRYDQLEVTPPQELAQIFKAR